jgi:hypothetical protein
MIENEFKALPSIQLDNQFNVSVSNFNLSQKNMNLNISEADLDIPYKFSTILEEIMKKKIMLKLHKNVTYIVDGRIIRFSDLIKLLCTSKSFSYRLSLEAVEREPFSMLIDFIDILEWSKEKFLFDVKADELNTWYDINHKSLDKVEELSRYLRVSHFTEYIKHRENKRKERIESETFRTAVDIRKIKSMTSIKIPVANEDSDHASEFSKTKNFHEAYPPKFNPKNISLELPIDITLIKLNATKNFTYKGRLNGILKDSNLSQLVDALISDSFWFVVCFFQSSNIKEKHKLDDLKKLVTEILKRISCNYFKFFINLCDDDSPVKKKDPVLNVFHDFMSQCVFYSLYLGFPKSRHIFNDEFRHKIISLFAYLYNGLNTQNNFSVDHWDLDLGTGNIIEPGNSNNSDKSKSNYINLKGFR